MLLVFVHEAVVLGILIWSDGNCAAAPRVARRGGHHARLFVLGCAARYKEPLREAARLRSLPFTLSLSPLLFHHSARRDGLAV